MSRRQISSENHFLFAEATAQAVIKRNVVYQTVIASTTTQTISALAVVDAQITNRNSMLTGDIIKVIIPTVIAVFCSGKVLSIKLN